MLNSRPVWRAACAALAVVVAIAPTGTITLPDFTLDLNPVSFEIKKPFLLTADKLTGNYHQVLVFNGDGTFAAEGYWDIGQLVHDDGTTPYNASVSRLGVDYALYAVFSYTGTFAQGDESSLLTPISGSLQLYLDRGANTGKSLPDVAPNAVSLSKSNDDVLLATGTLVQGAGHFRVSALSSGDFGLSFGPLALTIVGERYFVAPAPWESGLLLRGQFDDLGAVTVQQINGSADAVLTP